MTANEVRLNALEALAGHFEDEPVPQSRELKAILADPDIELDGSEVLGWVAYEQALAPA